MSKAQWTILTYIAAHNNLERWGQRSLGQILVVSSTPRLQLVALYDGPDGATRYIASEPGQVAVEEPLSDFDPGDPDASGWRPEDRERSGRGQPFYGWTPEEIARIA